MWHPFKSAWQQTETGRGLRFSDRTCRIERDTEEQRKRWSCTHGVYPPQSALSSKISSQETEKERVNERIKVKISQISFDSPQELNHQFSFNFHFFFCHNVILSWQCHSVILFTCGEHPTNPRSTFSSLNFQTQYAGAQLPSQKRTDYICTWLTHRPFAKSKKTLIRSNTNLLTK